MAEQDVAARLAEIRARSQGPGRYEFVPGEGPTRGIPLDADGDVDELLDQIDALRQKLSTKIVDIDDEWGANPCEVCGSGVLYGSRHHQCGAVVLRAEQAEQRLRVCEASLLRFVDSIDLRIDEYRDKYGIERRDLRWSDEFEAFVELARAALAGQDAPGEQA